MDKQTLIEFLDWLEDCTGLDINWSFQEKDKPERERSSEEIVDKFLKARE